MQQEPQTNQQPGAAGCLLKLPADAAIGARIDTHIDNTHKRTDNTVVYNVWSHAAQWQPGVRPCQPTRQPLDTTERGAFPVNPVGFQFWSVPLLEKSWLAILSGLIEVFKLVAEDSNHYEVTNVAIGCYPRLQATTNKRDAIFVETKNRSENNNNIKISILSWTCYGQQVDWWETTNYNVHFFEKQTFPTAAWMHFPPGVSVFSILFNKCSHSLAH